MTITPSSGNSTPVEPAPLDLVGVREICDILLKIGRQYVLELTLRGDFPEPASELAEGAVWHREDVEAWMTEHGEAVGDMLKQASMAR